MKMRLTPSITAACLLVAGASASAQGLYAYGYGYGYGYGTGYGYGYPGVAYPAPGQRPQAYSGYPRYAQPARPQAQDPAPAGNQGDAGEGHQINISGMRFSPATLEVNVGDAGT